LSQPNTRASVFQAAVWMSGAIFAFTSMAVAGRELSPELDTFEIMTYRSMIGVVLVMSIGGFAGTLNQITRRDLHLHGARNLAHFTGQNLWFYAITVIPLAQVFVFEFTSPIWVTLLAPLFLGETLTRRKILLTLVGFLGILIVARPGAAPISPGMIAAALSAVCFAATAIFTKKLTQRETITCIMFYLTSIQLCFGLVASGFDGDIAWPSSQAWPWLFVVGISGLLAHFCLTTALKLAPASVVMPIDFARLPVIIVIGAVFYNEPIEAAVMIGAVLIFAATYANIAFETRKGR
jgi:drug/metabolite transporter (DMT)-like permease